MNLLKDVLANEVYPAFGCTEPVSCAYAAATAAAQLGEPVEKVTLKADAGTYKNGAAVVVPKSGGAKGNLIAAALGAVIANPDAKLLLLQHVTAGVLTRAQSLMADGQLESPRRPPSSINRTGIDIQRITLAVNNVIGDLSGLICDGAKPGCAMKAVTAVDTANGQPRSDEDGLGDEVGADTDCFTQNRHSANPSSCLLRQHFLNFLPLPQGHGSFRPTGGCSRRIGRGPESLSSSPTTIRGPKSCSSCS